MIKTIGLLLFCLSGIVFAQDDITLSDPFLSLKYSRGPHLIFDCVDNHWVCAGKYEYKNCEEAREFEILERKDKLSCVPVRVFESEAVCVTSQRGITNRSIYIRFCVHPEIQKATSLEFID